MKNAKFVKFLLPIVKFVLLEELILLNVLFLLQLPNLLKFQMSLLDLLKLSIVRNNVKLVKKFQIDVLLVMLIESHHQHVLAKKDFIKIIIKYVNHVQFNVTVVILLHLVQNVLETELILQHVHVQLELITLEQ